MPPQFRSELSFYSEIIPSIIIISFKRLPKKRSMPFLVSSVNGSPIRNLHPGVESPYKYVSILFPLSSSQFYIRAIFLPAQELICSAAFGFPAAFSPNIESFSKVLLMASISEISQGTMTVGVHRQACSGIPLAVRFVGRDRLL